MATSSRFSRTVRSSAGLRALAVSLALVLLSTPRRAASGDGEAVVRLAGRTVVFAADAAVHPLAPPVPPSSDGRYVVVLAVPATASVKSDLGDGGAVTEAYVPDQALLVKMTSPSALSTVLRKPYVRAVFALAPADKISPRVTTAAWPDEPALRGLLTVQVGPGEDVERVARVAQESAGGIAVAIRRGGTWPRFTFRTAPGNEAVAAAALAALPGVVWVEPAGLVHFLNDTSIWVGQSWDTTAFSTPVFAHGLFGEGQIIGVSDTGVDADHGAFYDPTQGLPGPIVNPLQRKIIVYHDRLLTGDWDNNNHGTHTAGTLAGDLNKNRTWDANGANQAPDGMAPAAKLAVSDANDTCLPGNPIDLRELFQETYADGARIHSNSWASCGCNDYTVHSQDVDDFLWSNRDMAIFFAAGNSGSGVNTVLSPGTAKDCVTVGATQRAGAADALAGFSSRGPADDGRLKPTVTAPGVNIRSALGDKDITTFNDGVAAFSGTSMATPTTAGLATLVREYLVKGWYPSGTANAGDSIPDPSAALMKAMLVNSARNMASETVAPSNDQGWGRVLLDDVLYFAGDARRLWLVDEPVGLGAPGDKRTYALTVGPGVSDFKVTLAWTDPPATTLAGPKLVNDLDLVVSGPAGATFRGNNFAVGFSVAGGSADRLNVEEGVRVQAPAAGLWTVTVSAANIPQGPQPFAVVATGDVRPAPHLSFASDLVTDPDGNGDGIPQPGELLRVDVTLVEDGGAPATGISARLEPLVAWAKVVLGDVRAFADAAPRGQTRVASVYYVALDPAAPCGGLLPFALHTTSNQGPSEAGFDVTVGGDVTTTTTLLQDSFDALTAGAPPDPVKWTVGLLSAPVAGLTLRVEADATVEPPGTPAASAPNALYIGRRSTTTDQSVSFLATRTFDLSGYNRAHLSFRYWVRNLEGGIALADRLVVEASTDGGTSFPVPLYTNPDYASGMDSSSYPGKRWHFVDLDLATAGLVGPKVALRFVVTVNADETLDAVYLDDVRLDAAVVSCKNMCVPPAFVPATFGPVCLGSSSALTSLVLARGFGPFASTWSFGDTTQATAVSLDALLSHRYVSSGSFRATLEAVSASDPTCRRSEAVDVAVDSPPVLAASVNQPVCLASPTATLVASVSAPGFGPMSYQWDFGDGSPVSPVADPTVPVMHLYPAVLASYTARLTASDTRVGGCTAVFPVKVDVVASGAPSGSIGNVVRAAKRGSAVALDWSAGVLVPRTYNVHRTALKAMLVETAAALGMQPVVASATGVEAASDTPPVAAALWHYKVVPRDGCTGKSVLP